MNRYLLALCIAACLSLSSGATAENSDPRIDQARSLMAAGETDSSIALLSKVVAESPENYRAQYNLGLSMALGGQDAQALVAFDSARKLFEKGGQTDATIFNTYGWQLLRTGQVEAAIQQFESGLQHFDSLSRNSKSRLLNNYGLALMQANRYSDAEAPLLRAAEEYGNPLAERNLQVVRTLQGEGDSWTVVIGADRTLEAAQHELARADQARIPGLAVVLRAGFFRTVARALSRAEAEDALVKAKALRADAYLVRSASWCPEAKPEGSYLKCAD